MASDGEWWNSLSTHPLWLSAGPGVVSLNIWNIDVGMECRDHIESFESKYDFLWDCGSLESQVESVGRFLFIVPVYWHSECLSFKGHVLFLGEELRASLASSVDMPFETRPNLATPFLEFSDRWGETFMGTSPIWVTFGKLWALALVTPRVVLFVISEFWYQNFFWGSVLWNSRKRGKGGCLVRVPGWASLVYVMVGVEAEHGVEVSCGRVMHFNAVSLKNLPKDQFIISQITISQITDNKPLSEPLTVWFTDVYASFGLDELNLKLLILLNTFWRKLSPLLLWTSCSTWRLSLPIEFLQLNLSYKN